MSAPHPEPIEDDATRQSRMRRAWLATLNSLKHAFQLGGHEGAVEPPQEQQAGPSSRLQQLKNVLEARKVRRHTRLCSYANPLWSQAADVGPRSSPASKAICHRNIETVWH